MCAFRFEEEAEGDVDNPRHGLRKKTKRRPLDVQAMADAAVAVARDEAGADERAPAHGGSSGMTGAGPGPRVCFRGQADAVEPARHQARTGADACWIGLSGAERRDFS